MNPQQPSQPDHPRPPHPDRTAKVARAGDRSRSKDSAQDSAQTDENPNKIRLAPGVEVHNDKLRFATSRSSGPGGQNVNKLETRVELRIHLKDLPIPKDAKQRLATLAGKRLIGLPPTPPPPPPSPPSSPPPPHALPTPASHSPTTNPPSQGGADAKTTTPSQGHFQRSPLQVEDEREILIASDEHRSQRRNKEATIERLAELVREAMVRPKVRKKTKPSRAAQQRRIDDKKARGQTKRRRQDPDY